MFLEKLHHNLLTYPELKLFLLSCGLVCIYWIIKFFLYRLIRKQKNTTEAQKILQRHRLNTYGRYFLILTIFLLWFSQLQTVFVSLLAFAAAIVLALKEVIMCITGGMVTRLNKQFKMGDSIEVDGVRGFVIYMSLTVTKILELGPEKHSHQTTGNVLTIPNSLFLSKTSTNHSAFQNYSIRTFHFPPVSAKDLESTENILLKIAKEVSAPYLDYASHSISSFCQKEGLTIPNLGPRIKIQLNDKGEIKMLLKMPVDNQKMSDIEQLLLRRYHKEVLQNLT